MRSPKRVKTKEHIGGAVELLKAARAGDDAKVATAKRSWYRNGRQIARFLSAANPLFLPFSRISALSGRARAITLPPTSGRQVRSRCL
jgi:hypothetical protein